MSLVTSPGASDADSYISVEEADDLLNNHSLSVDDWRSFELSKQEASLRWATNILDNYIEWNGSPTNPTIQALQHPRTGLFDKMGNVVPDNEILPELKIATALLAVYLLENNPLNNSSIFKSVSLGAGLSFKVSDTDSEFIPDYIINFISYWGTPSKNIKNSEVRLFRC